jgi:hypothetical protein
MALLVRTPLPYRTESARGYVLRLAEANGASVKELLRYAGVQVNANTIRLPLDKLEPLLGCAPGRLSGISNVGEEINGKREFSILGHGSGLTVRQEFIRFRHPKFCIKCAQESNFIDALFDLELVVACPRHRCALISRCTSCGNDLQWFRRGLLTCTCGHSLEQNESSLLPECVIELMTILAKRVHGESLAECQNHSNFPIEHLESVPLWSLLWILDRLGRCELQSCGLPRNSPMEAVAHAAAEVLRDWPHNFHALLRRIGEQGKAMGEKGIGISERYKGFYKQLFRTKLYSDAAAFLKQEYLYFGTSNCGTCVVDERSLGKADAARRFVSKAQLATHLGVTLPTLNKLIDSGAVTLTKVTTDKAHRYVADLLSMTVRKRGTGRSLGFREAAHVLGLPVEVLRDLRKSGHFVATQLSARLASFHEEDVKTFDRRLRPLEALAKINHLSKDLISLREVMGKLKFGSTSHKAQFVRDYLDGRVFVEGKGEDGDVYFDRQMALEVALNRRVSLRDVLTVRETGRMLYCKESAVNALIDRGYLVRVQYKGKPAVSKVSVDTFNGAYVAAARLVRHRKFSVRRLFALAKQAQLQFMSVTAKGSGDIVSFFKREDEAAIIIDIEQFQKSDEIESPVLARKVNGRVMPPAKVATTDLMRRIEIPDL